MFFCLTDHFPQSSGNLRHCQIKTVYQAVAIPNIKSTVNGLRKKTRLKAILTLLKTYPHRLKIICQESSGEKKCRESKQEVLWHWFELIPESCTHRQKALHLRIKLQATTAFHQQQVLRYHLIILLVLTRGFMSNDRRKLTTTVKPKRHK